MKYLLLHVLDESAERRPGEEEEIAVSLSAWIEQTKAAAVNLHGSRLAPVSDATTVRVRHGELLVADGPFAETKEQIAGYDVLECDDIAEAVEVAARHPTLRLGCIEVRPLAGR